jgi:hypothetical protein
MVLFMGVKRGVAVIELVENVSFEDFIPKSSCREVHRNFIYLYWLIYKNLLQMIDGFIIANGLLLPVVTKVLIIFIPS